MKSNLDRMRSAAGKGRKKPAPPPTTVAPPPAAQQPPPPPAPPRERRGPPRLPDGSAFAMHWSERADRWIGRLTVNGVEFAAEAPTVFTLCSRLDRQFRLAEKKVDAEPGMG